MLETREAASRLFRRRDAPFRVFQRVLEVLRPVEGTGAGSGEGVGSPDINDWKASGERRPLSWG
jgi:hypothetical protein